MMGTKGSIASAFICFAAGFFGVRHLGAPNMPTVQNSSVEAATGAASKEGRPDGHAGLLLLNLLPKAVRVGGVEVLEFEVRMTSEFAGTASAVTTLELVTDSGDEVQAPQKLATLQVGSKATVSAANYRIPAGLADGYYSVRATCAAADGQRTEVKVESQYFHVRSGVQSPMSMSDWYHQSNANVATAL